MLTPWPMPCHPTPWPLPSHPTRLLATPALITVADTAGTPSLPTTASFWPPISSTSTLRFFGSGGAVALGQLTHFTRLRAPTTPNCGNSLPHSTTSSRTRSGVGRFNESLHVLTNCPSVSRSDCDSLIRLFSWLTSPERADASAVARPFVAATRSPAGNPRAVLIAAVTSAVDA